MAKALSSLESLAALLDASNRPMYAIDDRCQIVFCNRALAGWMDLHRSRIVGRFVEYHSESSGDTISRGDAAPLTDLCPPPRALTGESCSGIISCAARGGGLVHRRAEFLSLGSTGSRSGPRGSHALLVLLADRDLTPQELAAGTPHESAADELHRTIRQFRRSQAVRFSIESILGGSPTMQKVRSQIAAAAHSRANTLICGRPGTGRGHIARAIHYQAVGEATGKVIPLDCALANEDMIRRAFGAIGADASVSHSATTLILENLDRLALPHQAQILATIRRLASPLQIIATADPLDDRAVPPVATDVEPARELDEELMAVVSTITIRVPRLCERMEDLPVLAQFFLESANRDHGKQIGDMRADAIDLLSLHSWPGELDELRQVITSAHRAAESHEITPADLPAVVHHAFKSAGRQRRKPERIVLDDLLATIEKEAIVRALSQADGNKTEAAEMLGMTRPRLYRRLVQLGLAGPEFIEHESNEDSR